MGAFKTSHFEERKVCHNYSPIPTMTGFKENDCGKSTQNGCGICFEGLVSVSFAFLNYACYCFLAIYIESNILVHESLL